MLSATHEGGVSWHCPHCHDTNGGFDSIEEASAALKKHLAKKHKIKEPAWRRIERGHYVFVNASHDLLASVLQTDEGWLALPNVEIIETSLGDLTYPTLEEAKDEAESLSSKTVRCLLV